MLTATHCSTAAAFPYCATYRSVYGAYTLQGYQCADVKDVITVDSSYGGSGNASASAPAVVTVTTFPSNAVQPTLVVGTISAGSASADTGTGSGGSQGGSKGLTKGELAGVILGVFTILGVLIKWCRKNDARRGVPKSSLIAHHGETIHRSLPRQPSQPAGHPAACHPSQRPP